MKYQLPAICSLAFISFACPALADYTIDSPTGIEQGAKDVFINNSFAFDHRNDQDHYREHVFGFDYGVTNWWNFTLEGHVENTATSSDSHFVATNIESIFSLTKPNEYWVDVGILTHYQIGASHGADELELALLLEKQTGKFTHTANIKLDYEVGNHRSSGVNTGLSWRTSYQYKQEINPAIEIYNDFGRINKVAGYDDQTHQIGPAIQGEFDNGLSYDIGWLFGISKPTDDNTLKFNVAYGF